MLYVHFFRLGDSTKNIHTKPLIMLNDFRSFLAKIGEKITGYSIPNRRKFCKWLQEKTAKFSAVRYLDFPFVRNSVGSDTIAY